MSERFKWNANNLAVYIVVTEKKRQNISGYQKPKIRMATARTHTQTLAKNKMVV